MGIFSIYYFLPFLLCGYLCASCFLLPLLLYRQRERLPHYNCQSFLVSQALVHFPRIPALYFSARLLNIHYPENHAGAIPCTALEK